MTSFSPLHRDENQIEPFIVRNSIRGSTNAAEMFYLFFSDDVIYRIVTSTNLCAKNRLVEIEASGNNELHKPWKDVIR